MSTLVKNQTRDKLIEENLGLVRFFANQLLRKCHGAVSYDDLVSQGNVGLIEAASRYRSDENVKFATFAKTRIYGAMLDYIESFARWTKTVGAAARRRLAEIEASIGRTPTDEEFAESEGVSIERARCMKVRASLSIVSTEDNDGRLGKIVENLRCSEDSPEESAIHSDTGEQLQSAISSLRPRDAMIIRLYYFEDLTMAEVAEQLGMSQGNVSRRHACALKALYGKVSMDTARRPEPVVALKTSNRREKRTRRIIEEVLRRAA